MCAEQIRRQAPQGFVKTAGPAKPALTGEQKAQLIRRANELFNKGDFGMAERIYIATGYSDGMVRMGDTHFRQQRYREAMRLYMLAPAPDRVSRLARRMALVVQQWLIEDSQTDAAIRRIGGNPNKDTPPS